MAAKDCTADFIVEDDESESVDIHQATGWGHKAGTQAPSRDSSGPASAAAAVSAKRPPLGRVPAAAGGQNDELDAHRITQRQKMIDKGKNTLGYQRFIQAVPKHCRSNEHPRTPDVHMSASKRKFDGLVSAWRRKLHEYDEEAVGNSIAAQTAVKGHQVRPGRRHEEAGGVAIATAAAGPRDDITGPAGEACEADGADAPDQDENLAPPRSEEDMALMDEASRGSLDAYFPPKAIAKRGREPYIMDFQDVPAAQLLHGPYGGSSGEPQPKRSTASRSMEASHQSALLTSTCSNQPLLTSTAVVPTAGSSGTGPTSFAGLGLAARARAGDGGVSDVVAAVPPTAAPVPARPHVDRSENLVALILGPEAGSCMSWASDS